MLQGVGRDRAPRLLAAAPVLRFLNGAPPRIAMNLTALPRDLLMRIIKGLSLSHPGYPVARRLVATCKALGWLTELEFVFLLVDESGYALTTLDTLGRRQGPQFHFGHDAFTGVACYRNGVVTGDFMYEVWLDSGLDLLVVNAGYFARPKDCARPAAYGLPRAPCGCSCCAQLSAAWASAMAQRPDLPALLRETSQGSLAVRLTPRTATPLVFRFTAAGLKARASPRLRGGGQGPAPPPWRFWSFPHHDW